MIFGIGINNLTCELLYFVLHFSKAFDAVKLSVFDQLSSNAPKIWPTNKQNLGLLLPRQFHLSTPCLSQSFYSWKPILASWKIYFFVHGIVCILLLCTNLILSMTSCMGCSCYFILSFHDILFVNIH